jgi:Ran GTPase-activating protein (RanGAP) involved in mRNA processing and transport
MIQDAGIEALAAVFAANPTRTLRILLMSGLQIGDGAMRPLGAAFASLALRELHLGSTNVGPRLAMEALCKHLSDLPDLETLALQKCSMGFDGLQVLVGVLPSMTKLRYLTLDSNTLGSEVIGTLLHAGVVLHTLSCQYCAITEEAPIVAALKAGAAPLLEQFALKGNTFRETSGLVAAAAKREPVISLPNFVEASNVAWRAS